MKLSIYRIFYIFSILLSIFDYYSVYCHTVNNNTTHHHHQQHSCPPELGFYSTCCPSYSYDPYTYPPICDFFPVDSRYIPETCEYHELITGISCKTREYFMEMALNFTFEESGSKCPQFPFGAVIVNHTAGPEIEDAEVISIGMNKVYKEGSHLWHGEIAAIHRAGKVLKERFGKSTVSSPELWQQLSLYTTGEPCPLCASAIRWSKIGEVIYSTSIPELNQAYYFQPNIRMADIQQKTNWCKFGGVNATTSYQTRIIVNVLANKTLPYFLSYNPAYPCPEGCHRLRANEPCVDKYRKK